jgi:hypothetical protein
MNISRDGTLLFSFSSSIYKSYRDEASMTELGLVMQWIARKRRLCHFCAVPSHPVEGVLQFENPTRTFFDSKSKTLTAKSAKLAKLSIEIRCKPDKNRPSSKQNMAAAMNAFSLPAPKL